jgi:hypothetical protein
VAIRRKERPTPRGDRSPEASFGGECRLSLSAISEWVRKIDNVGVQALLQEGPIFGHFASCVCRVQRGKGWVSDCMGSNRGEWLARQRTEFVGIDEVAVAKSL